MKKFLLRSAMVFAVMMTLFLGWAGWIAFSTLLTLNAYKPAVGDVLVQDISPCGRLLRAVKGITESEWCHCGVVDRVDGQWVVYEAVGAGVKTTPLMHFLLRGDNLHFAAYRLSEPFRHQAAQFAKACVQYLGRPYDIQYELDDEKIYCSELVYKAYLAATGDTLVNTQEFGDLNWENYVADIQHYSGKDDISEVMEREVVSPVELTYSKRLQKVFEVNQN